MSVHEEPTREYVTVLLAKVVGPSRAAELVERVEGEKRTKTLIEAADALSVWPGDQTPEEERPGYDGPTIDAADRLDDALRPMPWEDRAQLISEHRQMVVGEVAAELRRMAAAGQAPAPEPAMPEDVRRAAIRAVEQHPSTTFMAPCESLADAVLDAVLPLLAGQAPAPSADGLRERIKQALSNAGAFCGDDCCAFQPGDRGCPDCERHWDRCADAVMPVLAASAESGAES